MSSYPEEDEHVTVKEAAQLLEVSQRTVRRRIKSGKLEAEKIDGPYGKQYMLPADQFADIAKDIRDVVSVEQPVSIQRLQEAVQEAIKEVVQEEVKPLQERIDHLEAQLEARDKKLMETIREKQEQEEDSPSPWERVQSWFR